MTVYKLPPKFLIFKGLYIHSCVVKCIAQDVLIIVSIVIKARCDDSFYSRFMIIQIIRVFRYFAETWTYCGDHKYVYLITHYDVIIELNLLQISLCMQYRRNISSIFSRNSEASLQNFRKPYRKTFFDTAKGQYFTNKCPQNLSQGFFVVKVLTNIPYFLEMAVSFPFIRI